MTENAGGASSLVADLRWGERRWPLSEQPVTIGRSVVADIQVDHPEVSRRHARLRPDPQVGWLLEDLGSANGTYLDGHRVSTAIVAAGSMISLGQSRDAPRLTVGSPAEQAGREVTSTGVSWLTIGRAADNGLVVEDLSASRHHARATRRVEGFWIEDLDSLNGTYLNGSAIREGLLRAGDLMTIGALEFRVHDGELVMSRCRREVSLAARDLRVVLKGGKELLGGVDFALPSSSLMAVIGPSGAGKSTLLGALTGSAKASHGQVTFDGRDLYENFAELRHRVGLVPQDDVVHPQLTVRQALEYASRLRFPADLDSGARRARMDQVVNELELTAHYDTRIDRLSGGQRKRTSVALELLTEPSLLFLDEPTSGLDPGLDKSVMTTLRGLADSGRTIIVVTHNVANLGICDRVLLLAPGGRVAYFGSPDRLLGYFGRADYSDVFTLVASRPDDVTAAFRAHAALEPIDYGLEAARTDRPAAAPLRQQPISSQLVTLARRHVRVMVADSSYALFMLALPIVLALLVLAVPGDGGFGPPTLQRPTESLQLLVVLIVGAAFMGVAASARDLVGERAIYHRERGVGLSAIAYLGAKLAVFAALSALQSAVLVAVVMLVTEPPPGHVVLGHGVAELYVAVAATAYCSAVLGLLISATVSTSEQVMPLLVVGIMAQLVLCGGLIPVAGQTVLEQLSWITPSRWGYAAGAATVDVLAIPKVEHDPLWEHTATAWLTAIAALAALTAAMAALTGWRLHRPSRSH